jgi:hypothetical protein
MPTRKPDDSESAALGQFRNPLRGGLGQFHDLRARSRLRLGGWRG